MDLKFLKKLEKEAAELDRLDEMIPPEPNDGDRVGFTVGKNPMTQYVGQVPATGQLPFAHMDDTAPIAVESLPYPLEQSVAELIAIYTSVYQYKNKVSRAINNPAIKDDPKKILALRKIRARLAVILLSLKRIPPLLEGVSISKTTDNEDEDFKLDSNGRQQHQDKT